MDNNQIPQDDTPKILRFEDCYEVIKQTVESKRHKWTLTSLPHLDFDDISSIIVTHIWRKFHLYDQSRPLIPWLNRVIAHQLSNLIRNNYSSFSRPCLRCPANEGDNFCSIYGTQNVQCPLYLKWTKSKKNAHDIKLPLPMVNHEQEVFDLFSKNNIDIERTSKELHEKIKPHLSILESKIYKMIFIQNLSEEEPAEKLGIKTTEKHRKAGYRTISIAKKKIILKAHELIYSDQIDFFK